MECKKCGGKIINNCCIRCGLLTNGNMVKQDEEVTDNHHVQRLYNKNFDTMNRNEKTYINFLLGPLYFSYRGHLILGIISVFIDYLLFYFISTFISSASYISLLTNSSTALGFSFLSLCSTLESRHSPISPIFITPSFLYFFE